MAQAAVMDEAGHATLLVCMRRAGIAGVVGIVAGRIKERHNRPALAGAVVDGVVKGSARSCGGGGFGARDHGGAELMGCC